MPPLVEPEPAIQVGSIALANEPPAVRVVSEGRRRVVLVGNPNVGKSVLFGKLTGTYVTVSNYPGTTVEITRGHARIGAVDQLVDAEIIDTPGTNNLVPMSDDEAVTRSILIEERHDAIVQVGDAKALSRVILLALQLRDIGQPFCLVLNMVDELAARGIAIDLPTLSARIGVPVFATAALIGDGVEALRAAIVEPIVVHEGEGVARAALPDDVIAAIDELTSALASDPGDRRFVVRPRAIAIALLSGDEAAAPSLPVSIIARAVVLRAAIQASHAMPAFAVMNRARLQAAQRIVREVQQKIDVAALSGKRVSWPRSIGFGAIAALVGGVIVDGAIGLLGIAPEKGDALASYGTGPILSRLFSRDLLHGWHPLGLAFAGVVFALATLSARGASRLRSTGWKLLGAWAVGYVAFWITALGEQILRGHTGGVPVAVGAVAAIGVLAIASYAGEGADVRFTQKLGALTLRPIAGLPFLAASLLIAYQIVGVFGAGTAVGWLERDLFGSALALTTLDGSAKTAPDTADEGAHRLVVTALSLGRYDVRAEVKIAREFVLDSSVRMTTEGAASTLVEPGHVIVEGGRGKIVKAGAGDSMRSRSAASITSAFGR